jgi:putative transposase
MKQLKEPYPVQQLCDLLNCARSRYYDEPHQKDEAALVATIEDIMMRWPRYGYRRILAQLQREGVDAGARVVRRLLKALGGSYQVGRVRIRTTDSNHEHWRYPNLLKQLAITHPDQAWAADITYIRFGHRFIYLAIILDVYTRAVRGWAVSRNIDQQLTLAALQMALQQGRPLIFHSDQGVQYAAWEHTELLKVASVQISMADAGQPTQNAFAERFIRTFKEEHVDFADYHSFDDACEQIGHWLDVTYNTLRIHSAHDYLTPAEFEPAFLERLASPFAFA